MSHLRLPRLDPTPEAIYLDRRQFLKQMGFGAAALAAGLTCVPACAAEADPQAQRDRILRPGLERPDILKLYPAPRNPRYNLDTPLTDPLLPATHNNFYEFSEDKSAVWPLAQAFEVDPWTVEVTGECHQPRRFDIDALHRLPGAGRELEERTYRFRCVEAWAMDVPWTGFALRRLLEAVQPTSHARFVRFLSATSEVMPGLKDARYPWPYFEALRMDEAMHELTLLATGIYGRPLPRQHGAPFRVVVPWKYGYKSPKSIVRIELTRDQPPTFWETLYPLEYPFLSNVDPAVRHPRWSQASEQVLGGGRRPTLKYNGYGEYVARLYE